MLSKTLKFNKIEYKHVFCDEFNDFKENNEILFQKNIAILYGPNGTGKTSLSKVLNSLNKVKGVSFEIEIGGEKQVSIEDLFHVISDQNSRNIIKGTAKDYLIGDNIEKEERLSKDIEEGFNKLCESVRATLKNEYKITTMTNKLLDTIENADIKRYAKNFANNKFKGTQIDRDDYINKVTSLTVVNVDLVENISYQFIIDDYNAKDSIVHKIMAISMKDIQKNTKVREIEESDEAIKIINKFAYKQECVVCDNEDYDQQNLLDKKQTNKIKIEEQLDDKTKRILNGIIKLVKEQPQDPLNIESTFLEAIKTGDITFVEHLKMNINNYLKDIGNNVSYLLKVSLSEELKREYEEYKKILQEQVKIDEEDLLYLKEVIGQNVGREVQIDRGTDKKLRITLGGNEFLETDRDKLGLSTGQQNFISLSFELLKAKKSDKQYIVMDDPISSFDSIYKNKIAFCIVKFLEGRKQIILTHNTELIKLLEFQARNSFELYLFNNTNGAQNGFIQVHKNEQEILLQLNKLLDLFRGDIWRYVKKGNNPEEEYENKKRFLMSMIPFMRGYANIIGEKDVYKALCKVMHGYETEYVDIAHMYKKLFKVEIDSVEVSVKAILEVDLEDKEILDISTYPLLNKTLYHTLSYLFLRLTVEKELCAIKTPKGTEFTTQQIIDSAFNRKDKSKIDERVFFTSRKTLLNEFNHFEGNMNIFQPAIDITDQALEQEKVAILDKLALLKGKHPSSNVLLSEISSVFKDDATSVAQSMK